MAEVVIEARGVSKQFILRHNKGLSIKTRLLALVNERQRERLEPFWALREVSLSIGRGEQIGLIGRNGSGKSTLLKLIAGIHRPTSGRLLVARGTTIGTMIELGLGFHPDLTGTENVFLNAAIHGRSRADIEAMYPKIVEYSGLEHFMDVALKNYSSGMHLRLGFAVAANLDPDVILLDEVFAVGDEEFQRKCMDTMNRFASEGRTIVFVSHAMSAVRQMCRRVCVLDGGVLHFDGDTDDGIAAYHKLITVRTAAAQAATEADTAAVRTSAADAATIARRHITAWLLEAIGGNGLASGLRMLEIGVNPEPDALSPIRQHAGAGCYAYWQAAAAADPDVDPVDVVLAATIFVHFPLNAIGRIIATAMRHLTADGRIYVTFYEAPENDPFTPVSWPGEIVTSADALPYQYTFAMIRGVASAFGAAATRVEGVSHPNGETVVRLTRHTDAATR